MFKMVQHSKFFIGLAKSYNQKSSTIPVKKHVKIKEEENIVVPRDIGRKL